MKTVLIFLTDGYADWEPAFIAAELKKPEHGVVIKTIALDKQPKTSMGGFRVLPDFGLEDPVLETEDVALLLISGGTGWHEAKNHTVTTLVDACLERHIPVAAICDAVTFLANQGYLDTIKHTGNTLPYVQAMAPNYKGQHLFVEEQAVTDGKFITANGTAALEFAREILRLLKVKPHMDYASPLLDALQVDPQDPVAGWYALQKQGMFGK